ncbi:TSUP family transporter [Rhodovibrionaceae bacterium A322]
MSFFVLPSFSLEELLILTVSAALAGVVRGFSGFGAAMIFLPLASMVVDPRVAVITLFLADLLMSLPLFWRALPHCAWRSVLLLWAGAALAVPFGTYFLATIDAVLLRWILATIILVLVAVLMTGWRYQKAPSSPMTFGVGGMAGAMGGLAGLSGPPVILFMLGGPVASTVVRANMVVFLGLSTLTSGGAYYWRDLFTAEAFSLALVLGPLYGLSLWAGAHSFGKTNEELYRRVALGICAGAALLSLPLWDLLG